MTGSYNWTRRASRADENMIRVWGDAALAAGYTEAFAQRLEQLQRQDWAAAQTRIAALLARGVALIERYADRWTWDWAGFSGLSLNERLPWSHALYERYVDRWHVIKVTWHYDGGVRSLTLEQVDRLMRIFYENQLLE
jgi:hypothetical protein